MAMVAPLLKEVAPFAAVGMTTAILMLVLAAFKDTGIGSTAANTAIDQIISGLGYIGTFAGILMLIVIARPLIKSFMPSKGGSF